MVINLYIHLSKFVIIIMKEKINRILEISKQVISDCCMENGGIVAANSTKGYFPVAAKDYFYVWPRDASFVCIASDIIGINNIQEGFFNWCSSCAEGFNETGLFYEKYYPNGLKASFNFQPDQTGIFLHALVHYCKYNPIKINQFKNLTRLAANGICNTWAKDHFKVVTNDLWEERFCYPDLRENFTYSLAACIRGLRSACELFPNELWKDVAEEMKLQLDNHFSGYFIRSFGKLPDRRIDASALGLVYPFAIYEANDPRIMASINKIEKKLVVDGGVYRYEHDEYDGWIYEGHHRNKGAGTWPVLNFWLSIYYSIRGDSESAQKYYYWVLDRIPLNGFIPEQLFDNTIQVSVSPLLWSHAMFILASGHLGFIKAHHSPDN